MAQHTIDLPCIADTYCSYENPSINYGRTNVLRAGGYINYTELRYYALLKFNASIIPPRKKINYVGLRLYSIKSMPAAANARIVFGMHDRSWDETTANYNNQGDAMEYFTNSKYVSSGISANSWIETDITISSILSAITSGDIATKGIYFYWRNVTPPEPPSSDYWEVHSRENTNAPVLRVIYEDVPPDKPTLISPIGEYKDSFATIRFEWDYNSSVGGEQKKFDLRWSTDQETWTTISQTTSNTYYDAPGGTFPTGNIYWQVRTYNEYDEASEWSDIQSFYVVGAPNAPTISSVSAGTARPTVSWAAFNQQIYQLQILSGGTVVYDSGEQPGINTRQHKVTAWLTDGNYTARIRIKNEYDMWSEWGSTIFTVSTAKPQKPSFSLQRSSHGIEINIQGTYGYALIYRAEYGSDDFICIGNVTGKYFHDCSVKSGTEYRYFVRAVSANETYADSELKIVKAEIRYSLIAPASDLTDVFEFRRSLNSPPKRNYTRTLGGSSVEFEGRKYPVWIPNEHVSAGLALTFFLNSWRAVEKFMDLYDRKETVLYRDSKGRKIYGVLSGLSVEEEREGYTVSFVISQVDYDEEVEV